MTFEFETVECAAFINGRECDDIVTYSPTGAEIHLYIDRYTRELLLAQRLDGEWTDIPLKEAERDFAAVLYAAR